jgi:glucose 1-dehydrogenase
LIIARRSHADYPVNLDGCHVSRRSIAMKLLGKTALVTGAGRGIGRGCALELARAGADVVINDRERNAQTQEVVAEIRALGRHAVLIEGSVFHRSTCEDVVSRTITAL